MFQITRLFLRKTSIIFNFPLRKKTKHLRNCLIKRTKKEMHPTGASLDVILWMNYPYPFTFFMWAIRSSTLFE